MTVTLAVGQLDRRHCSRSAGRYTWRRALHEEGGVPSYWVVDPDEPSVLVLELKDGRYVEPARTSGEEVPNLQETVPPTAKLG